MKKSYKIGFDAIEKMVFGVDKLANMVKVTIGPKGKNVVIDKNFASPLITNDGVTIARSFECQDSTENVGVKLIKEVSQKTNDIAGDGTTTATVLAQKMLSQGLKAIRNDCNPISINKGISKACSLAITLLNKIKKDISNEKDIENVAYISCQDKNLSQMIAESYKKLNGNCSIILQDSNTSESSLVFQEGMKIEKGFLSPYFCNNNEKNQVVYDEAYICILDMKLTNFNLLIGILEKIMKAGKPLLIICDDIEQEVLSTLIINKMRGNFNCCVVKCPLFGDKKIALMEDIASLCDTTVISATSNKRIEELDLSDLGLLKQAKIDINSTTIVAKQPNKNRLDERIKSIQTQINSCQTDFDKDALKKRLANLTGGIATLFVGAQSDVEQKEKKLRIEDAISATNSAIESGILPGGGVALLKIKKDLKKFVEQLRGEEKIGGHIVLDSLEEPIIQILINAGENYPVVIKNILAKKQKSYGYDALCGKYCDMIKSGIIDPAKVTITALSMACSVVKMILTTEGIIFEEE